MIHIAGATQQPVIATRDEVAFLSYYTQSVKQAGVRSDPSAIVNVYVSLKSRPIVVLAGPAGSGKEVLIQCLARLLFGKDCYQCQMMTGHPWWAAKTSNIPFFVQIQNNFNSQKILFLLEEALQPQNFQREFLASLIHISPSELERFFADVGFQVQHREIVRFGDMHLPEPVPFPPNLSLIGTMDVAQFDGWSKDLLSGATVVPWMAPSMDLPECPIDPAPPISGEKIFLESRFQDPGTAYQHLHQVLGTPRHTPFEPFFAIKALIERHAVLLPPQVNRDVIIYLANAWSINGDGLFDPIPQKNLTVALDYAMAQLVLPWLKLDPRKSIALFDALQHYCANRFPVSGDQIQRFVETEGNPSKRSIDFPARR